MACSSPITVLQNFVVFSLPSQPKPKTMMAIIISNKACERTVRSVVQKRRGASRIHSWAKEAEEAERLEKMQKIENEENAAANNLALAIQSRNEARASQSDKFFDSLIDKYAKKAEKTTKKKTTPAKTVKTPKSTKKTKKKA